MVFTNLSKFSKNEALNYFEAIYKKDFYKKFIFPVILIIISVIILFLSFSNEDMSEYMTIGFAFSFISIFFLIYNVIQFTNIKRDLLKKNPELEEFGLIYEYELKEESFNVTVKIGKTVTKSKAKYSDLHRIIQREDSMLLLFSPTEFVIIKRDGFKNNKDMDYFIHGLKKHKIKIKNQIKNN